ncbi:hypothetical protein OAN94_01585 [Verrucomicrobiales bacterium]|nr:hypothetical protein [Verrucomicrobiales bacterium]MDF1785278.1 hypothetical protein [Verrucomicrobiales bacterium]
MPLDCRKAEARGIQVSPNGKQLAVRYMHHTGVMTADLKKRFSGTDTSSRVTFSPDGSEALIPGSNRIVVESLTVKSEPRCLDFGAKGVAYSPDG